MAVVPEGLGGRGGGGGGGEGTLQTTGGSKRKTVLNTAFEAS